MTALPDLYPGFETRRFKTKGDEIASGHFLAEENPIDTLRALLPFITAK